MPDTQHSTHSPPTRVTLKEWVAISGAMLGSFLAVVDILITNAAIKDIQGALSATLDEASLISTSYLVAEIIMIPLSGWLMKVFSLRRFFLLCCGLFTIASLACSFAWNLESMIVFRALQGFGGGALVPLGFTVIMIRLPIEKRPMGLAIFSLTATMGLAVGPAIGGLMVELFDWRYIFLINIPTGLLMMGMLAFGLDTTRGDISLLKRGDYLGIATMAVGLSSLQIMLEKGRRENWFESDLIVSLGLLSAISIALFIIIELRTKNPLVNLRLFAQRDFLFGSCANALMGLGLFGTAFILPLYLAGIHDYTARQTGIVFMWMGLPQLLLVPLVPRLMRIFDPRNIAIVGFAIFSLSCFLSINLNRDFSGDQFLILQLLRALGQPLALVPLTVITVQHITHADTPSASSLFNLLRKLGGAISIALLATVLETHETIHFAHINEAVSLIDSQTQASLEAVSQVLISQGIPPYESRQTTIGLIAEVMKRDSRIMAFSDAMFLIGSGLALACFVVWPISSKRKPSRKATSTNSTPENLIVQELA